MKKLNEIQTMQINGGGMESWMRYDPDPDIQMLLCSNLWGFIDSGQSYFINIVHTQYSSDLEWCMSMDT